MQAQQYGKALADQTGVAFPARFGAVARALALLAALASCSSSNAGSDRSTRDAAAAKVCSKDAQCVLIARGCCSACEPTADDVIAVLSAEQEAAREKICPQPVACGPCEVTVYDPTRAHVVAACEAAHCVVRDVRKDASSACARDADCELHSSGCCPSCGGDPSGYIALRKGEPDPVTCDPVPPCAPCEESIAPQPYCAGDGHCAVRTP